MTTRRLLAIAVAVFIAAMSIAPPAHAQGLKFFKNYFESGGHFAAGVPLKGKGVGGFATDTIEIPGDVNGKTGVPFIDGNNNGKFDPGEDSADVLAAFLYWETVTTTTGDGANGAYFNGHSIQAIAKNLNPSGTPPCWSNGGATGGGSDAHLLKSYRADVLPFLPATGLHGKRSGIGTHTVVLPDGGSGNMVPSTAGATLLIIYRSPNVDAPLTSTVIYDGGFTLNQSTQNLTLRLEGWYQASNSNPVASLTEIVGNGQSNFAETISVKDSSGASVFSTANPFVGPNWDTYTTPLPLTGGATSATVTVSRGGTSGSFDCLSWGAMVLSTTVQDSDNDGIIDRLESSGTSGTVSDPTGQPLPDLYAMGARPNIKDIFIEFAMMKSTPGYTNPLQTVAAGHTHLPAREALDLVAKAFRFDPRERINVHFDIGNNYQDNVLPGGNWNNCPTADAATWTTSCAIVRANLADGGEFIEETACTPSATQSCLFSNYPAPLPCSTQVQCQFPDFPGTVGWKSGFRFYRDEPLNYRKTKTVTVGPKTYTVDAGPDERACYLAETDLNADGTPNLSTSCRRRFSRARKDLFHWVLWSHATGIPRTTDAHTPRNMSGIGDYIGSDLMVSLGLWDFAVGTPFMQASTLMHELGHNLGRRHGGDPDEPNCKPNYQSVMNYLFQVRGLIDAKGVRQLGYSNQQLPALDETTLKEADGLGTMDFRTRWFTPWPTFVDTALTTSPTTRPCNGSTLVGPQMSRVDGTTVSGPLDWNGDGSISAVPITLQDLDFSTSFEPLAAGSNDWTNLRLAQVGSRRNVGGWSVDSGYWDAGYWDAGFSDPGYWDAGYWDAGYWDAGYWDAGYWDAGYWDAGVELDSAAPFELDRTTAAAISNAPSTANAVVSGKNIAVSWTPPTVDSDKVSFYEVYRIEGTSVSPVTLATRVQIGSSLYPPTLSVVDTTAKNNVAYIYFVLAQFTDGTRSGITVSQTVTK